MPTAWSPELRLTVDEVLPGAQATPHDDGPGDRYYAFPRAGRARYLVPLDARRPAAAGTAGYARLQRPGQRWVRRAAALAVATGRRHLPGGNVLRAPSSDRSLRMRLQELLDVDGVHLGVSVRPINPHHKPTVRVLRNDGSTIAFCKVGRRPAAKTRLTREADALQKLGRTARPHVRIPAVLHVGDWQGRTILVTAPIPPDSRRVRDDQLDRTFPFLGEVLTEPRVVPLAATSYWRALPSRLDPIDDGPGPAGTTHLLAATRRSLAALTERFADVPLLCGFAHGDWVPWNLAWRGQELWCWDLEWFQSEAPFGQDIVHGLCHTVQSKQRLTVARAVRAAQPAAARALAAVGHSRRTAALVSATCAVELAVRALEVADPILGWQPGVDPFELATLVEQTARQSAQQGPRQ